MTDLEITRLCAEAMGLGWQDDRTDGGITAQEGTYNYKYDPLHDDAQAMALVKKMRLEISTFRGEWHVGNDMDWAWNTDLNRAICECVAKMQAAK